MQATVILHPGRDAALRRHHPWIFSGAVAEVKGSPASGDVVTVRSAQGEFLCYGDYSPTSQIRVRALSFHEDVPADSALICALLDEAAALRAPLIAAGNQGVRLVNAEGDGLPGLVVDRYGEQMVMSLSTAGMDNRRDELSAHLKRRYPECALYERSDQSARAREGLKERSGTLWGPEPRPGYVRECAYREQTIDLPYDVTGGHKTGAYLDQRAARAHAGTLSRDARVLNLCCYTGGFALHALKGGARQIHNVDSSAPALENARQAVIHNHLDPGRCRFTRADVFTFLREEVTRGSSYDLVILDPPKFAASQAALARACRGYQDLNRLALTLLKAGGTLLTFSCSGALSPALFDKLVADAALEAGVRARIMRRFTQDSDHPVGLACPESAYLKGLELAVSPASQSLAQANPPGPGTSPD